MSFLRLLENKVSRPPERSRITLSQPVLLVLPNLFSFFVEDPKPTNNNLAFSAALLIFNFLLAFVDLDLDLLLALDNSLRLTADQGAVYLMRRFFCLFGFSYFG